MFEVALLFIAMSMFHMGKGFSKWISNTIQYQRL